MFLHALAPGQQAHLLLSYEQFLQHHEFDVHLQSLATLLSLHKGASVCDLAQEAVVIPALALKAAFS